MTFATTTSRIGATTIMDFASFWKSSEYSGSNRVTALT
jgi:hypothetical protein